jgi:hypothetical protein
MTNMNSETPVSRLASSFGTLAILSWFIFLGPVGAIILFGVAQSMLGDNYGMTTFLIGLTSVPVSLTVLWGTISGISLTERTGAESADFNISRAKIKA